MKNQIVSNFTLMLSQAISSASQKYGPLIDDEVTRFV